MACLVVALSATLSFRINRLTGLPPEGYVVVKTRYGRYLVASRPKT